MNGGHNCNWRCYPGYHIEPYEKENQAMPELNMDDFANRHPGTKGLLRHFTYGHLPPRLQHISEACCNLANGMALSLPDNPELTTGLRKLLEAKDCFVRAELDRTE